VELDRAAGRNGALRGMTTQLNKVYSVKTIALVAQELGENEDWLWDIANGMEPEDGLIWVHGPNDEGVMAFSDFGVENLCELIVIHRDNPK
jgi:hypothetical protein